MRWFGKMGLAPLVTSMFSPDKSFDSLDSGALSFVSRFPGFDFAQLMQNQEFQDFVRLLEPPVQLKSSSVKSQPSSGDRVTNTRKFLTVNQMIMYLQEMPSFGKHAYYGCWCFPEGPDEPLNGYGEPVDDIDKTCKRLSQCYKCASMKYGKENCPSNTHYEFTGIYDEATRMKTIECLDPEGSCARSLCECDRNLASNLADQQNEWEESLHAKWGNFDRENICRIKSSRQGYNYNSGEMLRSRDRSQGNGPALDACCGEEGQRFPFDSRNRACCGNRTYNVFTMKCCAGKVTNTHELC